MHSSLIESARAHLRPRVAIILLAGIVAPYIAAEVFDFVPGSPALSVVYPVAGQLSLVPFELKPEGFLVAVPGQFVFLSLLAAAITKSPFKPLRMLASIGALMACTAAGISILFFAGSAVRTAGALLAAREYRFAVGIGAAFLVLLYICIALTALNVGSIVARGRVNFDFFRVPVILTAISANLMALRAARWGALSTDAGELSTPAGYVAGILVAVLVSILFGVLYIEGAKPKA